MRLTLLVLLWLCFFGTATSANETDPLIQELLAARDECVADLLSLGLIDGQESEARNDRIERCVTDKIGFNRHVLALVTEREEMNPNTQVFFIDSVEEIRDRMERIPDPFAPG